MSAPTSYSYHWKRNGTYIADNSPDYTISAADQGMTISCEVTATNADGSTSATSTVTSPVAAAVEAGPFGAVAFAQRSFAIAGATVLSAMQDGRPDVTEVVLQAVWNNLQPDGAGTSLSSSGLTSLREQFSSAGSAGTAVLLEFALHYAPSWAVATLEPFTDQVGNTWAGSETAGDDVANWFWTSLGRQYATDFMTKVTSALGASLMAQVTHIRIGNGPYGETHYPIRPANQGSAPPPANSFYGYGASQQHGNGLAPGLAVCPLPGYVPFSGGGGYQQSVANDRTWVAWYNSGLTEWLRYMNRTLVGLGWTSQRLMVLHPGYGVRSNQSAGSVGYQRSVAAGEDPVAVMASYEDDTNMWPWCTWIDGPDGWSPPQVDSDFAAWKKLYATAVAYGKANYMRGENTSAASGPGTMDAVFTNALAVGPPASGYPLGVTSSDWQGYKGLMWLDYGGLTGGQAGLATMTDYKQSIVAIYGAGGASRPAPA